VCRAFDTSIGFHSGSGKSAENYRVMGAVTGGRLEIKTSGRYTYEMGVALSTSKNPSDAALWRDWYVFTIDMAIAGAFSSDQTEQKMARAFISDALGPPPKTGARMNPFDSPTSCRRALEALPPSPEYMFFFEYNFLFVLAAGGRPDKTALGDHSPAGYGQRARFYRSAPKRGSTSPRRLLTTSSFWPRRPGWSRPIDALPPPRDSITTARSTICSRRFDATADRLGNRPSEADLHADLKSATRAEVRAAEWIPEVVGEALAGEIQKRRAKGSGS
jgi:hypothetical protein